MLFYASILSLISVSVASPRRADGADDKRLIPAIFVVIFSVGGVICSRWFPYPDEWQAWTVFAIFLLLSLKGCSFIVSYVRRKSNSSHGW